MLYMSKQSIHSLHNIHSCNGMQLTQSNYNVDSSTKSSNYMKIQLKVLNYFELQCKVHHTLIKYKTINTDMKKINCVRTHPKWGYFTQTSTNFKIILRITATSN